MAKIVINIDMDELQSGINQVVDDDMYEMEEVEFVCPLPTQDSDLNSENREYVIKEHSYGASENKKEMCGTCSYYSIKSEMLDCLSSGLDMDVDGIGYCVKFDFACKAENVCDAWESGGPITDFDDINTLEPIEGNERDIF
jgi:hypothetical protein|tara:strand:- start:244 stop:666 length:423 start_codon:yes stop_codon:yes gene_type:complete